MADEMVRVREGRTLQRFDEEAWRDKVDAAKTKPTRYRATADGYDGGQLIKAGTTFVTTSPRGSWMEPVSKAEAAATAATEPQRSDPDLEAMNLSALQAYAATLKVDSAGLKKADLITAIRAADDPTR